MEQVRRRRILIAAGIIAAAPLALAQKAVVPKLGLLWLGSPEATVLRNTLLEELRVRGYADGSNIAIEDASSVRQYELLDQAVGNLVRRKVDVIVVYGATATQAARRATSTIPIVMITAADPVALGIVGSLSRPGGNVTGVTQTGIDIVGKRLELLKEVVPRMRRVAIMLNPLSKAEVNGLRLAQKYASTLGLESYVAEVRAAEELERAFEGITQAKVDALKMIGSTMLFANRQKIAELTLQHRLPAIAGSKEYVDAGILLAYGADLNESFRQAGAYVAKILQGVSPAELPIEQSRKLEMFVNAKTARALAVTIPPSILLRADEVIQ